MTAHSLSQRIAAPTVGTWLTSNWMLFLTRIRGVILPTVPCEAYLLMRGRSRSLPLLVFGGLLSIAVYAALFPDAVSQFFEQYVLQKHRSLTTLSGRTFIWQYLLARFSDSPLFGFGFATGPRTLLLGHTTVIDAHNVWIEALLSLGLVGLSLLLSACSWGFLRALRMSRQTTDPDARLLAVWLLLLLSQSLTSTSIAMRSDELIILLTYISCGQLLARVPATPRSPSPLRPLPRRGM